MQYGYMSPLAMRIDSKTSQNAASKALSDFQMFVGLQPTGILGSRWAGYVVCMGGLKVRAEDTLEHSQKEITLEAIRHRSKDYINVNLKDICCTYIG